MPQPRFLLEQELTGPGDYTLVPEDSRHAAMALRMTAGDVLVVFDGRGRYADAVVTGTDKTGVTVRVDGVYNEEHIPLRLTIATAIPKGKRWQMLVEKCTELGVDRIIPIVSERSVSRGEGDAGKWRRWAIEAAKQSRRAWIPEVMEPVGLMDVPAFAKDRQAMLLVADPAGESPAAYRGIMEHVRELVALIGPEGGFSREELEECKRAGARTICLSPFNLRVETAAGALCAIVRESLM